MSEDEVQFLGIRTAPRGGISMHTLAHPFPSPQRPVTGMTLHVSENDSQSAHRMIFHRARTNAINVGRKPSTDIETRKESEPAEARFRCPVISRRHARIAFSDSGHVYIIDLNSHHGTHVLKPGETVSKALEPEKPTILADGDTITFGKTVGRDHQLVRPVTVRVELLFDGHANPSRSDIAGIVSIEPPKSSPRSTSGRYGVHLPDSDNSSSTSDHDSEIEIEEVMPLPRPSAAVDNNYRSSRLALPPFRALDMLKRLLPPAHDPSNPVPPRLPAIVSSGAALEPLPLEDPWFDEPVDAIVAHHSEHAGDITSRFTSPMELSSPSPPPEVIGAWPASRSPSRSDARWLLDSPPPFEDDFPLPLDPVTPARSVVVPPPARTTEIEIAEVNTPAKTTGDPLSPASHEAVAWSSRPSSVGPPSAWNVEEGSVSGSRYHEASSRYSSPMEEPRRSSDALRVADGPDGKEEIAGLKTSLEAVRAELQRLQSLRRKYKARFNSNVHTISDKLEDLDDQVEDVGATCAALSDQVDDISRVEIPALRAEVVSLQAKAKAFETSPGLHASIREALANREDVKLCVEGLHSLVSEMKLLREATDQQMCVHLEAVKAARVDALSSIAAEAETTTLSLKRKRDVSDEGPLDSGSSDAGVAVQTTTVSSTEGIEVPSPKRARKIVTLVAQTATAVTLGAVAAWSALAFS